MRTALKRYINFQLQKCGKCGHFVNKFATADEYYHTTYPLLLLYKYASEEELEKIVELQKEYIAEIFKLN